MRLGDLVKPVSKNDTNGGGMGIVLEADIQLWDYDTEPACVRVLWQDTMEIEIVFADEVILVSGQKLSDYKLTND